MEFKTEAMLLTAISKAYSMNGNEGVSHRVRVLVNGEIFVCKASVDLVNSLKGLENKMGIVSLKVRSPKEVLAMECIGFVPNK